MGRRPVAKGFPHGNSSVINPGLEAPNHVAQPGSDSLSLGKTFVPPVFRARSHRPFTESASFLELSGFAWVSKPLSAYNLSSSSHYGHIGSILSAKGSFLESHRRFMMGSSFVEDFQTAVLFVFVQSPHIVADAYHALLELMNNGKLQVASLDCLDLSMGARSLRSLIKLSSSIMQIEDAAVVIMLGQILLAYNAIIPLGSSTRTITRSTLWSVKNWYPTMLHEPRLDSIIIAPVLVDTIDCLIRRELPVVRLPTIERWTVDRLCGVSLPLLPLLYDLCECSFEAKRTASTTQLNEVFLNWNDSYRNIEQRIAAWTPILPPTFDRKFTTSEVVVMFAQARSYRLAALLIIHRLRFPLDIENIVAHRYALSILEELSPLKTWSSDGATALGLDFPLLVVMLEIPDGGKKVFESFESLRYRKRQSEDMLKFVRAVTEARQSGFRGLWFDLVEDNFHGDILP